MKKMIFLFMEFLFFCFPSINNYACDEISVDNAWITKQQYDYLFARYSAEYEDDNGSPPPPDSIAAWNDALIDRLYLLADALKMGYADDPYVNRIVNRAEIMMLTQVHGLLYDEVVMKRVNITEADIAEAYERRELEYEIRYIDIAGGDEITEASFDQAYDAKLSHGYAGTTTIRWPFGRFYAHRTYILGLAPGQVSRPLETEDGTVVIRMAVVKPATRKPFDELAPTLRTVLELNEEFRLRKEYEDEIHRTANTTIDSAAVGRFVSRLGAGETIDIDTIAVRDIRDLVLATYVCDLTPVRITVGGFVEHFNSLFMSKRLTDETVAISYLREMVFEVFAYADAVGRGLNRTEQFVNDKWNYTNMVILGEYEKREIDPRVIVTDSDCRAFYDAHRDRFVDGEIAVVDVLTFSSRSDAERARMRLMAATEADSTRVPEPDIKYNTEQDVAIRYDNADYPDDVRAMLFSMEDGGVSRVIEGNEEGETARVFVKKQETGRRLQPFEEVQTTIHRQVFADKKAAYKRALIDSLKREYHMDVSSEE